MKASPRARDKLLEAALLLFGKDGFFAVSEDDLIKEAKVSRGILVYHFGNKEGLLQEVLHSHIPQVRAVIPASDQAKGDISCWVDAWINSLHAYPHWWKCFFRLSLHPESQQWIESFKPFSETFALYREGLRTYFSSKEVDHIEEEILSFEAFRLGVSWAYLSHPDTYPIRQMKEAWENKFS